MLILQRTPAKPVIKYRIPAIERMKNMLLCQ